MTTGISGKNRKLLEKLNRTQRGPFTAEDVAEILGLNQVETSHLLTYFVKKRWLSRVRRGIYIVVPLGTIDPKKYSENPWIVAQNIFAPCYIAGWSAAEYWGLTEQIFNSVVVITTRPQRKKKVQIKNTEFITKTVNDRFFKNMKPVWIDNVKVFISDPTQTIVDILGDPSLGGGIRNVADIVIEYFSSKYKNERKLINYITTKNNRTIYKRLGFLIENLKISANELKKHCRNNLSSGFTLLDPSMENRGKYNTRWNLRINVRLNR